jgi:hypothetical protein
MYMNKKLILAIILLIGTINCSVLRVDKNTLRVSYNDQHYNYHIERQNFRSSNYKIYVDNVQVDVPESRNTVYYSGYLVNDRNSLIAVSLYNNIYRGHLNIDNVKYQLEYSKYGYTITHTEFEQDELLFSEGELEVDSYNNLSSNNLLKTNRVGNETDASDYLAKLYVYVNSHRDTLPYFDHVQIFSGTDLVGSTIGYATVCSLCTSKSGAIIMTPYNSKTVASYSANIASHELMHAFCAHHDDTPVPPCSKGYIMWPSSSRTNPAMLFSSCSHDYYNNVFLPKYNSSINLQCLENKPVVI